MKTIMFAALSLTLLACGASTQPASATDAAPIVAPCADAAPPPVVRDAGAPDVTIDAPCSLSVDSLEATTVFYGQAHNTLITAHGSCFEGVRDVEVNVASVPFTVLDEHTLIFLAAYEPIDPGTFELPYRAEVDIIKKQPDQVQTFITYTAQ